MKRNEFPFERRAEFLFIISCLVEVNDIACEVKGSEFADEGVFCVFEELGIIGKEAYDKFYRCRYQDASHEIESRCFCY